MSPDHRPGRPRTDCLDPHGFVLLSVLIVIGTVSALATSASVATRIERAGADLELRLVQASALADAGLTRAVAALEAQEDPLAASLLADQRPIRWRFAGREIVLSLVPEVGKVDLNTGDAEFVVNVLRAVVRDDAESDRLVRRLAALRQARQPLETVRGLLDPGDRSGPLARDLEAVFTVWTSLRGVDPKAASSIVLRQLPGLQDGEADLLEQAINSGSAAELSPFLARFGPLLGAARPIYRARAEVGIESGVTIRKEALLAHNPTTRTVWVVLWRDVVE